MKQTQTTSLQFSETAKAKPVEVVQQADLLTEREAHQSLCEHKEDQCLDTVNGQLMLEQEDSQDETAQLQADVQLRKQLSVATSLNEKENSQLKAKLEKVTKQLEQVQTAHQATEALLERELEANQPTVKELRQKLERCQTENDALKTENDSYKKRFELEKQLSKQAKKNQTTKERIDRNYDELKLRELQPFIREPIQSRRGSLSRRPSIQLPKLNTEDGTSLVSSKLGSHARL